ncbi:hypothetical protein MICRO8M_60031 [Microbacterium sp. 8M]|nr:hypothetical protein MICRO8M_60031 [Microbacterium sp. 8M]
MEDLYEQCSLHITEYIASSPEVGRRPRISRIRAYSSSLRPSAAYGCSFSGVAAAFATESGTCAVGVFGVVTRAPGERGVGADPVYFANKRPNPGRTRRSLAVTPQVRAAFRPRIESKAGRSVARPQRRHRGDRAMTRRKQDRHERDV